MNYSHIRELVPASLWEAINSAECIHWEDIKCVKLYQQYLLIQHLCKKSDDYRLHNLLHTTYWKLVEQVNLLETILKFLECDFLVVTRSLEICHHHN